MLALQNYRYEESRFDEAIRRLEEHQQLLLLPLVLYLQSLGATAKRTPWLIQGMVAADATARASKPGRRLFCAGKFKSRAGRPAAEKVTSVVLMHALDATVGEREKIPLSLVVLLSML